LPVEPEVEEVEEEKEEGGIEPEVVAEKAEGINILVSMSAHITIMHYNSRSFTSFYSCLF
jgi:hypothetical protein